MTFRYWTLIITLGAAWGCSFFLNEILLREVGPWTVSAGRVTLGAIGCWAYVVATGRMRAMPRALIRQLLFLGVLQFAMPFAVLPVSQQHITSGAAGTLNAMTPIMVVIVSHFWRGGERATMAKSAGVLFGFAGIVILMLPAMADGSSQVWAMLVALMAPVFYGISLNYMRRFKGVDSATMAAVALTGAAMFMGPLALATDGVPVITRVETFAAFATIGFVLTAATFLVMFWMIPRIGATNASTVTFISPVSAVILGMVFLGEQITHNDVAGMFAIFCGLMLIDGRIIARWNAWRNAPHGLPA